MGYAEKIYYLYPNAVDGDFELRQAGQAVTIKFWDEQKLGAQPSIETIEAVDDTVAGNNALNKQKEGEFNISAIKALVKTLGSYVNELRSFHGLPAVTMNEFKKEFKDNF